MYFRYNEEEKLEKHKKKQVVWKVHAFSNNLTLQILVAEYLGSLKNIFWVF